MDPAIAMAQAFAPSLPGGADNAANGIHSIVQPSTDQIDKFQNMMGAQQDGSHAIVESQGVAPASGENLVRSAIESQDASSQQMMSDLHRFYDAAPTMPAQSALVESGRIAMEMGFTMANMQAKQ